VKMDRITAVDLLGRAEPLLARAAIMSACAASQAAPNAWTDARPDSRREV
jgi:hypothetical protein